MSAVDSRRVVVSGGSSGLGAAVVKLFTQQGDDVTILDIAEPTNTDATWINCDLSNAGSIASAGEALGTAPIDVLCNVAGVPGTAAPGNVLAVNFFGLRTLSELLVGRMPAGSSVVNVASTAGWHWRERMETVLVLIDADGIDSAPDISAKLDLDGPTAYEVSKEAVIVWTILTAQAWRSRGVRINSVSPGALATSMLPAFYQSMGADLLDALKDRAGGRHGRPEEVAPVVVFVAGPSASWINGTDIVVDSGAEAAFHVDQWLESAR